jgi:catechol 2,3-dioxygenase-like lactoylglutathione lyase family enzyme
MKTRVLAVIILSLAMALPGFGQHARRPAIVGISHVTLRAANLAKSRQFYMGALGFGDELGNNQRHARFHIDFHQYIELTAAPNPPVDRLVEVGFETKDAEGLRRYLAAHGVQVPREVRPGPDGTRSFTMHDPEGHQISFEQYTGKSGMLEAVNSPPISRHMIHAGFIVRDRAAEDRFYKNLLGFHVYWHGGMKNGETDWVDMQVPNGTDWLEYMLNVSQNPSASESGEVRHLALGVADIKSAVKMVEQRGWPIPEPPEVGRDGKWQLNLYDPDLTRVEVMEFRPVEPPCCAKYTRPHPGNR